jgi:uncharacterized protein YndB with AHSA1/START domain
MKEFSTSVLILAGPRRIWQVLTDVERWPEWTASIGRIERPVPASLAIGSKVRIEQPKLRPAVWTVTEWQPEHRFTWVSGFPGATITAEHVINAGPAGSTVVLTLRMGGLLGTPFARFVGTLIERNLALEAAGLKQRSEAVR